MAKRRLHLINLGNIDQNTKTLTDILRQRLHDAANELSNVRISQVFHNGNTIAKESAEIIRDVYPIARLINTDVLTLPDDFPEDRVNQVKHLMRDEQRFDVFFQRARGLDQHDVILADEIFIYYFICFVMDIPAANSANMKLTAGSISRITVSPEQKIDLSSFNDTGHFT